jgi:hypothetical protein
MAAVRPGTASFEQKYVFRPGARSVVLGWLECWCVRDPRFSTGLVSSIYYDTPELDMYQEKRNSDYLKAKVRLRWYGDPATGSLAADVPCFLEIKQKTGAVRHKGRIPLTLPASCLSGDPFTDRRIATLPADYAHAISSQSLPRALRFPAGTLVPVVLIQYARRRFVDPQSGSRLAVDTDIRCTQANPALLHGLPPVLLETGVLEIKGPTRLLPGWLAPIRREFRREAFSKYSHCCECLVQPLGRRV